MPDVTETEDLAVSEYDAQRVVQGSTPGGRNAGPRGAEPGQDPGSLIEEPSEDDRTRRPRQTSRATHSRSPRPRRPKPRMPLTRFITINRLLSGRSLVRAQPGSPVFYQQSEWLVGSVVPLGANPDLISVYKAVPMISTRYQRVAIAPCNTDATRRL